MLGKIWKKVLMLVLIIACLWSITSKLVQRESLKNQLESTVEYIKNNNITFTQNVISK